MKSHRDVIIRPVVSEKSYAGLEAGTYTFLVDPRANKTEIKEAVQASGGPGDLREHAEPPRQGEAPRVHQGKRADEKRAIVTLAPGDAIEIFESGK